MLKRYGMFIAGVIFSALGISLITKAGLGTSPITSLAFVLTFIWIFLCTNVVLTSVLQWIIMSFVFVKDSGCTDF